MLLKYLIVNVLYKQNHIVYKVNYLFLRMLMCIEFI